MIYRMESLAITKQREKLKKTKQTNEKNMNYLGNFASTRDAEIRGILFVRLGDGKSREVFVLCKCPRSHPIEYKDSKQVTATVTKQEQETMSGYYVSESDSGSFELSEVSIKEIPNWIHSAPKAIVLITYDMANQHG
jgi:hypothetical protein